MALSPIREFGLKAVLWLPLAFVIWFWAAPLWVLPAMLIAKPVLLGHWGDLFESVRLGGELLDDAGRVLARESYLVSLGTRVVVVVDGGTGVLEPTLNPMIYAWSLPLFGGLAMATPLSTGRRLAQLALALAVIWLAQAFGIVAESLKTLAFDAGPSGAAAIARAGLDRNAIALAYQSATLILPAIVPVALWIGMNRAFIESLVGHRREPGRRDGV